MRHLLLPCLLLLPVALRAQGTKEVEPNDTPATATLLNVGDQAYGTILAGDVDCFRVNVTSASDLRAFTAPGFGAQVGNSHLDLLNSSGVVIASNDTGGPTFGAYSQITQTLAAGTYYLGVRGRSATDVGTYTLDVAVGPLGTFLTPAPVLPRSEGAEPNDPRVIGGAATATFLNTTNSGNLSSGGGAEIWSTTAPASDYDFWALTIPAASVPITVQTWTAAGAVPSVTDTVLHLCDSALNRLAFSDDFLGLGRFSQITYTFTAPGTYYFVVNGYGGTDAGNYRLNMIVFTTPPLGVASVTIHPGGCAGSAGIPSLSTRIVSTGQGVRVEKPIIGTTYYLDVASLPVSSAILRALGIARFAPPVNLSFLGAPGCFAEVNSTALDVAIADASGVNFWGLAIPMIPGLIGLPLEHQVLVLDPPANALGLSLTNSVSSLVGVSAN